MNNKITNNFFFNYYNESIQDETLLKLIPIELYMYVNQEITNYNNNQDKAKINFNQFQFDLFNQLNLNYTSELEAFVFEINKNKK